jgi:hypothetical protein
MGVRPKDEEAREGNAICYDGRGVRMAAAGTCERRLEAGEECSRARGRKNPGSMRGELATTKMRLLVPHVAFVVTSQHHGASAQRQESHASRSH